jgi:Concanavalin A-like lectin/glucanases superfamily
LPPTRSFLYARRHRRPPRAPPGISPRCAARSRHDHRHHRNLVLSPFQDYILRCAAGANNLTVKLTVWGGHNVVFQACNEYVANPGGDWAAVFENQTGVGNADTAAGLSSPTAQIQTSRVRRPEPVHDRDRVRSPARTGPGQIVGTNWNPGGTASVDDHSVYLDASGHADCYFWSWGVQRLGSPRSSADGRWHLVECAKGATGMTLDVDGGLVAANAFTGPTLADSGYWLIGNRRAGDGPRRSMVGQVGQVAIYGYALSQAQDADHWAIGQGGPSTGN